jgi:hypothetical protein
VQNVLRFPLRSVLALVAGTLCALPAAALAAPPANDAYLQSISVNKRGTPLTEEQVRDIRDTREATVQADLFSPPAAGGGRERTDCRGATFGATVWYDFHPHADGTVRVQAAGYDAVVAVYEFDPTKAMITSRVDCANQAGATEELFVKVKKGRSYTIQVGGVDAGQGPATGSLDFTFEYLSDLDGDGVLDALDRCPQQPGSRAAAGCPPEVKASAILSATPTGNGIQIRSLTVSATRDARVTVRCRRGCSFTQARTAHSTVGFRALRNRQLPAGARLEVFVTKPKSIGSYIRYTVTRGGFRRMTRCLKPGSMRPRRRCT